MKDHQIEKFNQIKDFAIKNKSFFIKTLHICYPLSDLMFIQYPKILGHKENQKQFLRNHLYSKDETVKKNKRIEYYIKNYEDFLWENLTPNWSIELIEDFENRISWNVLSKSENVNWTEELLLKYHDKWNWKYLAYNRRIIWTKNIIDIFNQKYASQYPELINLIQEKSSYQAIKNKQKWNQKLETKIPKIVSFENLINTNISDLKRWNWNEIKVIDYSPDLLLKYKNSLNFKYLTYHIDWDINLIQKFKNNLSWRTLSARKSIIWSNNIIQEFKDELFWFFIVNNNAIPWTLSLVEKFQDFWCWEFSYNLKGYYPQNMQVVLRDLIVKYLNDDNIFSILEEIEKSARR